MPLWTIWACRCPSFRPVMASRCTPGFYFLTYGAAPYTWLEVMLRHFSCESPRHVAGLVCESDITSPIYLELPRDFRRRVGAPPTNWKTRSLTQNTKSWIVISAQMSPQVCRASDQTGLPFHACMREPCVELPQASRSKEPAPCKRQ